MKITDGGPCPRCGATTAVPDPGAPWCPSCEWNLGVYDELLLPPRGWRAVTMWSHRRAYALNNALWQEVARGAARPSGWTNARILLTALSLLLLAVDLSAAVLGVALLIDGSSLFRVVFGVLFIGIAVLFRPRIGRAPRRKRRLTRHDAPDLYRLIDAVAEQVGAAPPDWIVLDDDVNASVQQVGFRRRTVLRIGIGLWSVLEPAERVALLSHEFGHLVSGDPNRALVVAPALGTFARLAQWTGADRTLASIFHAERRRVVFPQLVVELVLWAVSRVFLLIHLALLAIGARDHQRAEYRADQLATELAGTEATAALMEHLLFAREVSIHIGNLADTKPPSTWPTLADALLRQQRTDLERSIQLSTRRTTLWDSHPPAGLRYRMIVHRERADGHELLDDRLSARIDASLSSWYRRKHELILGRRDYRGPVDRSAATFRPGPAHAGRT